MKDTEVLRRLITLQGLKSPESEKFLSEWINDIKIQIAKDSAENIGFGNGLKTIEKCIKSNKKKGNGLHGMLRSSKLGVFVLTNGAYAAKCKSPMKMPIVDDKKEIADKILSTIKEASRTNKKTVLLPTRAELDTIIKIYKATPKDERPKAPEYDFGKGLPKVNAEFLSDILTLSPMATHAKLCEEAKERSSVYINFSPFEIILLPLTTKG